MLQLARAQDQTNRQLQQHLQQGQTNMQAHTGVLQQLATSTYQRNFDHIFACIPIYDGSDRPWRPIREELKRCFSEQTSLGHAAAELENMTQKCNEPLRLYIFRYLKIHKSVTMRDACYDTDPSGWFRFLTSIMNMTIANKITRSEPLPQSLQQCFEKAFRLEASLQLFAGVNMARRTTVMNIDLDENVEINLIKDVRPRSNACYKCEEVGHFQRDCKYDGDKPLTTNKHKEDNCLMTPMILWWESGGPT